MPIETICGSVTLPPNGAPGNHTVPNGGVKEPRSSSRAQLGFAANLADPAEPAFAFRSCDRLA